jgi:thiol-activated cytolysin
VKTVDGINGFKEFIIAGGEFSKDVPGDPIFYSASYLSDDSPFYAKFRVNIPYK